MSTKVFLLGTVATTPVTDYTPRGTAITRCRFETVTRVNDHRGVKMEVYDLHNIVAFGSIAEHWRDYLHKGTILYIEGRLQSRVVDGRRFVEVVARLMRLIGTKDTRRTVGQQINEGVFLQDGYPW